MSGYKTGVVGRGSLAIYQPILDVLWNTPWVVYYEPPLGHAQQIVRYLGQYSHRVAISNNRILNIDDKGVTFSYKDYKDNAKQKVMTLSGVEFLRRFCLHILPYRFVKIRYYGILSSKQKKQLNHFWSKNLQIIRKNQSVKEYFE